MSTVPIYWKDTPDGHDFPAAADYLDLHYDPNGVRDIVRRLQKAPLVQKKAKDIIRASRLPVLPQDNEHVKHLIHKAIDGGLWSPVLLVRGTPLTIADGYHRCCAAYWVSEDSIVHARIA
jgi:hypothetical protein